MVVFERIKIDEKVVDRELAPAVLVIYLRLRRVFLPAQPRRGGRAAECGGLLNLPALFVLTTFHLF